MPPPSATQLRLWQWRVLLSLMGCYLFYYTGRLAIGHALPLMEQDLGYSKQQLGWLAASLFVAYAFGQAINGNLGDWLGGRRMIALGAVGSMLCCWFFSLLDSLVALALVWGLNGFIQSMGWAPGGRLISIWWPSHRRGLAFGLYMLSAGCATVLVWLTSAAVLDWFATNDPARWRALFRWPLLALGASGVLFYLLVRDRPQDVGLPPVDDDQDKSASPAPLETRNWHQRYRLVLTNPWFLLACGTIFLQSFSRYGLLTWIAAYYAAAGIELNQSLRLTLSLPIGMGLGAVAGGAISDRFFPRRRSAVVALFLIISAACCLFLRAYPVTSQSDRTLGIALLFLAGFFVYGAQGPLWALCPDLVGRENSGTAVGLLDAVAYAGAAAQAPLLGYIVDHPAGYSYPGLFLTLAAATATGALLATPLRR